MKICVECKYIKNDNFSETKGHTCTHPDCRHVVSGRPQTCCDMRKAKGVCGVEGSKHEYKVFK